MSNLHCYFESLSLSLSSTVAFLLTTELHVPIRPQLAPIVDPPELALVLSLPPSFSFFSPLPAGGEGMAMGRETTRLPVPLPRLVVEPLAAAPELP